MEMIYDETRKKIIDAAREIVKEKSAGKITVRDILTRLNLTNRVFYNRFHNIDDVLDIMYTETVNKVRESLTVPWQDGMDFDKHIENITTRTLILSYESRKYMSPYIFEADSTKNTNFEWWSREIKKLISIGKKNNCLRTDLNEDAICYSIWCFIRGFNADAIARDLPLDEAIKQFQYGFGTLMKGMKP